MDNQNKNLILATALSFLVIVGWFLLFPPPPPPETPAPTVQTEATGAPAPGALPVETVVAREQVLNRSPRVPIRTERLSGSISLTGGRIDDLDLRDYFETIQPGSPTVTLLNPAGSPGAYYALYGWSPGPGLAPEAVPGPTTPWRIESGETLTETTPVTLVWDNGQGLTFRRTFAIDADFMFTVTQAVENRTGSPVELAPYGIIARQGMPTDLRNFYILHEGVIGMANGQLIETNWKNIPDMPFDAAEQASLEKIDVATDGWIGFTDHYWMSTLVGQPGQPFTAATKYNPASDTFQTDMRLPPVTVAPGQTAEATTWLFAGAKEWATIRNYQNGKGIDRFVDAIDWGWFFFLTKPIFRALHLLHAVIGNMGLAIIGLTVLIKALLFPLAYKSYVSMSRMKALQPQMEKLKEQAGDDRMKLQTEIMALYKREKVNPAAGCLPILLQIPIFFSLYKVIFVTLELRHAPFFGWIRDLSAPDPTSILNFFGLLPWAAPGHDSLFFIVSIGVLPILLGISMWLQMKLNPEPTDPTQAMIFAWMPWIFMFMMGGFASGLVVYWIANNLITFAQQYAIMRSQGVPPDVFGNIARTFKRKKAR